MKVIVLRKIIQHREIYAKKGEVIEIPDALAKQWLAAQHVAKAKGSK